MPETVNLGTISTSVVLDLSKFTTAGEQVKAILLSLGESMSALGEKSNGLKNAMSGFSSAMKRAAGSGDTLKSSTEQLAATMANLSGVFKGAGAAEQKQTQNLAAQTTETRKLAEASGQLAGKSGKVGEASKVGGSGVKEFTASLKDASGAAKEGGGAFGSLASGGLSRLTGLLTGLPGLLTAVTTGFIASAHAAASFEQMTQQVQANTGMSDEALGQMRETIVALGKESGASFESLAAGYQRVADFGFQGADATKVLTAAMKGAVATGADVGEMATAVAGAMHNYGIAADQAENVTGALMIAARKGRASFGEFTNALAPALATARAYGVGIADTSSLVSAMTQHQITASRAVTQFSGLVRAVAKPTAATREAIAYLNHETGVNLVHDFGAAALAHKGLHGVMEDVNKATQGQTDRIMRLFPQMRSQTAALIALKIGQADYRDTMNQTSDAISGKTQPVTEGYTRALGDFNTKTAELSNTFKALGQSIGKYILPELGAVVTHIKDAIDWFGKLAHAGIFAESDGVEEAAGKSALGTQEDVVRATKKKIAALQAAYGNGGERNPEKLQSLLLDAGVSSTNVDASNYQKTVKEWQADLAKQQKFQAYLQQLAETASKKQAAAKKAAPQTGNGTPNATDLGILGGGDDGDDFDDWEKGKKDAAKDAKETAKEARQQAREVNSAYQSLFSTIKGVELDKWAQKAFTIKDARDRYLDAIGDPEAITKRGEDAVKAAHDALEKLHVEAVAGRAKIAKDAADRAAKEAADATKERNAPITESLGKMATADTDANIGDPAEWAKSWKAYSNAAIDAGDVTKAAVREQAQFMVSTLEEAGQKGTMAWEIYVEEIKRLNREITADNKKAGKEIAASWAGSLQTIADTVKGVNDAGKATFKETQRQAKEAAENMRHFWSGVSSDIGHAAEESMNHWKGFKSFFQSLGADVKKILGDMVKELTKNTVLRALLGDKSGVSSSAPSWGNLGAIFGGGKSAGAAGAATPPIAGGGSPAGAGGASAGGGLAGLAGLFGKSGIGRALPWVGGGLLANQLLGNPLGKALGGLKKIFRFADGGLMKAGIPAFVAEPGTGGEMVVPRTDSLALPMNLMKQLGNHAAASALSQGRGGGGQLPPIHIAVNVAGGADSLGQINRAQIRNVARQIAWDTHAHLATATPERP